MASMPPLQPASPSEPRAAASVLERTTDRPSEPGVVLGDVWVDFVQHWPVILGATVVLSFAPSLVGRYLIPWAVLESVPDWLSWAAWPLWRLLRIAGDALAACVIITAVIKSRRRVAGGLASLALGAFSTALVVTFLLRIPGWFFSAAWWELLRPLMMRMNSMELLFLTFLRNLLELALVMAVTTTAGLAVAAAVTTPRQGVLAAFRAGFRAAERWRWVIALFVVARFLAAWALVFGTAALNADVLRSPIGFEVVRSIEQLLLTPLMTLALAEVFLRSTAAHAEPARAPSSPAGAAEAFR